MRAKQSAAWTRRMDNRETNMADYLDMNEFQAARAYSPAVITQGGRIVWLAGQTATREITVSHFARPGMLIEIQGVAVIGG